MKIQIMYTCRLYYLPTTSADIFDGIPVLCQYVDIKMAVLGKSNGERALGINELHLNTRVSLGVVGWNLENRQLALVEGKLLDGRCIWLDSFSNPDQLISSCELECDHLPFIMEGNNSHRTQPGVVKSSA